MPKVFDARHDSDLLREATIAYSQALLDGVLPDMRLAARGCGYALAVHGSLARDMDIVAIPWAQHCEPKEFLLDRLCGVLAGKLGRAVTIGGDWEPREHGRQACTIILPGFTPEIDFSVTPLATQD